MAKRRKVTLAEEMATGHFDPLKGKRFQYSFWTPHLMQRLVAKHGPIAYFRTDMQMVSGVIEAIAAHDEMGRPFSCFGCERNFAVEMRPCMIVVATPMRTDPPEKTLSTLGMGVCVDCAVLGEAYVMDKFLGPVREALKDVHLERHPKAEYPPTRELIGEPVH